MRWEERGESHLLIINNIWETWGIGENALKALVLANSPFPTQQETLGIDGDNDEKRGYPSITPKPSIVSLMDTVEGVFVYAETLFTRKKTLFTRI